MGYGGFCKLVNFSKLIYIHVLVNNNLCLCCYAKNAVNVVDSENKKLEYKELGGSGLIIKC